MKLGTKIILNIAISIVICTLAAVAISSAKIHAQGRQQLVEKSRAILSRLESIRTYIATQGGLESDINKALTTFPDGDLSPEMRDRILRKVPIFASIKVGFEGAEKDDYKFRVFSDEPRRKENKAILSELEILKRFDADPKLPEIVEETETQVTVYRPVRLSEAQGCLLCHGAPATSPWNNSKDILGFPMENWKDGKLHGVFAVTSSGSLAQRSATSAKEISNLIHESSTKVEQGHTVVRASEASLKEIVATIEQLSNLNKEISTASHEQEMGIGQINQALSGMEKITQNNSASAEECTAASEELNNQSLIMKSVVSQLTKVVSG